MQDCRSCNNAAVCAGDRKRGEAGVPFDELRLGQRTERVRNRMDETGPDNFEWPAEQLEQARAGLAVRQAHFRLLIRKSAHARALGVSEDELDELESGRRQRGDLERNEGLIGAEDDIPDEEFEDKHLRPTREDLQGGVRGRVLRLARPSLDVDQQAFADALGIPSDNSVACEEGGRLADDVIVAGTRALHATALDDTAFERSRVRHRF